jgi:Sulfotransferase domain
MVVDLFEQLKFSFKSRPDDIFIVTYPRSGTTWMQMIIYQLATDGDMSLSHIARFCPHLESDLLNKRDISRLPSPRVFKSHLSYWWVPKGDSKYIYVARDGRDVAVSYFYFYQRGGFRGTFEDFFGLFMRGKVTYGSWFDHVHGWWMHRNDHNVLFLWYEDLSNDLEGSIRRISEFCGFEIDPERFPTILERCSFNFMKAHEAKFDPLTERLWDNEIIPGHSFIRKGGVGGHKEYLSELQQTIFQQRFDKQMGKLAVDFFEIGTRTRHSSSS